MTDFLVDNSAWSRLVAGDAAVAARLRTIAASAIDLIVTCPPQVLEFCRHARTPEEFHRRRALITLGLPTANSPGEELVLDVQDAVIGAFPTTSHTVGVNEVLIASHALANNATVLCTTPVYARIAEVTGLQQERISTVRAR